jgi:hypothetical protein
MRDCYAISPPLSIHTESEGVGFEPTVDCRTLDFEPPPSKPFHARARAIRGDRANGVTQKNALAW